MTHRRKILVPLANPGVEVAVPVAVTGVDPLRSAFAVAGATDRLGLRREQRVDERGQQITQQIRTGLLQLLVEEPGRAILGPAVIVVSFFESIVRDHSKDPPGGRAYVGGTRSLRSVVHHSAGLHYAYGLAVDLNPFQNPYRKGQVLLPERARSYLDRDWLRPGMITPDGPVVHAFAMIGWEWGGSWSSLKDFQHFSASGR